MLIVALLEFRWLTENYWPSCCYADAGVTAGVQPVLCRRFHSTTDAQASAQRHLPTNSGSARHYLILSWVIHARRGLITYSGSNTACRNANE